MHIDLNADLGEGGPHDIELLKLVSSANVSCGVHAGDAETISNTLRMAVEHNVRTGAHPSFPDREHFGRRDMQLDFNALRSHLLYQLGAIATIATSVGATITYIKPHGALYNQAAKDTDLAEYIVRIVQEFNPTLTIVGLAGGELVRISNQMGLKSLSEVFADRVYSADGSLLPRSDPRALIQDPEQAIAQSLSMVLDGVVTAVDGSLVKVRADTLCLHGDTQEALLLARKLIVAFTVNNITVG